MTRHTRGLDYKELPCRPQALVTHRCPQASNAARLQNSPGAEKVHPQADRSLSDGGLPAAPLQDAGPSAPGLLGTALHLRLAELQTWSPGLRGPVPPPLEEAHVQVSRTAQTCAVHGQLPPPLTLHCECATHSKDTPQPECDQSPSCDTHQLTTSSVRWVRTPPTKLNHTPVSTLQTTAGSQLG